MFILVVAGHALAPFLILFSVRNFGGSWRQAWISFGFCALLYGHMGLHSASMLRHGFFPFQMGAFLSLWSVSLGWRWSQDGSWKNWAWMTGSLCVLFMVHSGIVIIVALPLGLLGLWLLRKRAWLQVSQGLAAIALIGLANWHWIHPYLAFRDWVVHVDHYASPGITGLRRRFFPVAGNVFDYLSIFNNLALAGMAAAAIHAFWKENRLKVFFFSAWGLWLLTAGFFGKYLPGVDDVGPGRYVLSLEILFYALAGLSLERLLGPNRQIRQGALIFLLLSIAGVSTLWWKWTFRTQPLQTTFPTIQSSLMDRLKESPDLGGRTLIQDRYGNEPHFLDIIPMTITRPTLGGSNSGNFLKSRSTLFFVENAGKGDREKPRVFGRFLNKMTEPEFYAYLDLYNVTRVAAWNKSSKAIFGKFSRLKLESSEMGYNLYTVERKESWFEKGGGELSYNYDQIVVKNPTPGPLVLKFHWIKTLRAEPDLPLQPVYLKDDPVPFISVPDTQGAATIRIYNAGL